MITPSNNIYPLYSQSGQAFPNEIVMRDTLQGIESRIQGHLKFMFNLQQQAQKSGRVL